jgi:hypothetical protein
LGQQEEFGWQGGPSGNKGSGRDERVPAVEGHDLLQALLSTIATLGIRKAVLIFPADQARMLNIAEDMAFAVGPMPAEALLLQATKDLTVL